jgi:hypothetical protein
MERRKSERYDINVDAEIVFNGSRCKAVIENFSDGGLGIRCPFDKEVDTLNAGDTVCIEFQIFYQEKVNFHCEVRWKKKVEDTRHGPSLWVGMEYLNAVE